MADERAVDTPQRSPLPSDASALTRQRSLAQLQLLDSAPEPSFDDLVDLASTICETPIALVTLLDTDRQWFKARRGLAMAETPLTQSFCAHAVGNPNELLVIEDAHEDARFRENPLVTTDPSIRAYAGMPVLDTTGTPLGTICVIDTQRRSFTPVQREALRVISKQISTLLELRQRVTQLQTLSRALQASNDQLGQFADIISHDLLAPIRHQVGFARVLEEDHGADLTPGARDIVTRISLAGDRAEELITDIGTYVQSGRHSGAAGEPVSVAGVIADAQRDLSWPEAIGLSVVGDLEVVVEANRAALYHILVNLLGNACKFCEAPGGKVRVNVVDRFDDVRIEVIDDGPGIPEAQWAKVFDLFQRGDNAHDKPGRGLGLSIARRLALSLCGELTVHRSATEETVLSLTVPKVSCYGVGE